MTPRDIVPYGTEYMNLFVSMQSICSFNIAAISSYNIMPCVNPAYGNHMECKNPCAICKDLVKEMYANIP